MTDQRSDGTQPSSPKAPKATPIEEGEVWQDGVSLRQWRLKNFKSIQDDAIELRPLTVVVGANSAGKSSLLQSILLMSQGAQVTGTRFPLNGAMVRLGTVEQSRYAGPGAGGEAIAIGATFDISPRRPGFESGTVGRTRRMANRLWLKDPVSLDWDVCLGTSGNLDSRHANVEALTLNIARRGTDEEPLAHLLVDAADVIGPEGDALTAEARPLQGQFLESDRTRQLSDVFLRGLMPVWAMVREPLADLLIGRWRGLCLDTAVGRAARSTGVNAESGEVRSGLVARAVQDVVTAVHMAAADLDTEAVQYLPRVFRQNSVVDALGDIDANYLTSAAFESALREALSDQGINGEVQVRNDLMVISTPVDLVNDFLVNKVRYLGPLRADPEVIFQDSPEAQAGSVGPKGEFTAAVLENHGSSIVSVPMPDLPVGRQRQVPLSVAVDRWAIAMDLVEAVSTSELGRIGLTLQIKQKGVKVPLDLTSVGTGVSQVLPVLVLCLQAPAGSLLMIEQPELHLNPRVQQVLADFLLKVAASGRQVIVETHSEYMVSRLRAHVAEADGDEVRRRIGLLFAERVDGRTVFRPVETNQYGGLPSWPQNFFDQSMEDTKRILKAAVAKRRSHEADVSEP